MNQLNELAGVCGNWMLHSGWQAAVVALVVIAILKVGHRKISSQLKYALLLIVLVKFATPPFLHLSTGLFSRPAIAQISEVTFSVPESFVIDGDTEIASLELLPANTLTAHEDVQNKEPASNLAPLSENLKIQTARESSSTELPARRPFPWLAGLFCVYCAGLLFFGLRLVVGILRLRKAVSDGEIQHDGPLQTELGGIAKRIGLRKVPELRISDQVDAPFATGALRSVIVLPRDLTHQLAPDQRRIVIAHELVHVRRWDLVIGWAEVWLGLLWWFHPAMWWLRRSLRQSREDCCDDVLIASQLAQPERYCETLIEAAASKPPLAMEPLALGFSNQEHPAGRRIRRLMDDSIVRTDRIRLSAICIAMLVALIALPGLRQSDESQAQDLQEQVRQKEQEKEQPRAGKRTISDRLATHPDASEFKSLKRITGQVVDEHGIPIEGATVDAWLGCYPKVHPGKWRQLAVQKLVTDENGKFELAVEKETGRDDQLSFSASICARNCFEKRFSHGIEKGKEAIELPPSELARGMRIKARVVAPDSSGDAPVNSYVTLRATVDRTQELYSQLNCDSEGFIEHVVPTTCTLELSALAENYASSSTKLELKPLETSTGDEIEERELGEFELKHGVSVFGVARRKDGTPAAGVVFGIIEGKTDWSSDVSSAKTDDQGRFRFAPHSGTCTVVALKECRNRGVVGGFERGLRSDGNFPLFDSVVVELDGKGPEFEIELTEAEAVVLSGVIRDEAGNPIPGVTVQRGWESELGNLEVEYLNTDELGRYSSRIPKGRAPFLQIRNWWVDQDMYEPYLANPRSNSSRELFSNAGVKRNEDLKFKSAMKSVSDLDWVMKKYRHRPNLLKRAGDLAKWWFLGEGRSR